jgi:hypothetical protein
VKFIATKHVLKRVQERGLSLEDMKNVVKYGAAQISLHHGKHGGIVKKLKKTVAGKTLVAVAEFKKQDCWLITAYYK